VRQRQANKERVVATKAAPQRLAQLGQLGAQPPLGQLGQDLGVALASHQRLQHRPTRGTQHVTRQGARVGKGGGFSDLEFALLLEAGLIGKHTVVATTVHPLQVLDEALPETDHDFRLDLIVAGEEVIPCRRSRRPAGILWGAPRRGQGRRHPRPGRPSTTSRIRVRP
jgi:hypothetical protein